MRIAVGGFLHESHSFAPRPTRYEDFVKPGGFPGLMSGPAMFDKLRNTSVPIAGALEEAEGVDLVALAWTFAEPAGPVQDEAFERVAGLICAELSRALDAGSLDGIYLDLHGAAVSDSFPDMEGELLRRVRAIAGAALPLTISLDPHANLTAEMVARVDAAVPFRTYPHIDMRAAGAQAMRLLRQRIENGRPWAKAFRQLDYWLPITTQCTMMDPMQSAMTERTRIGAGDRVAELAFCFGFPYADFADCGAAVAAFATTEAEAERAADAMISYLSAHESDFRLDVLPASHAVAEAVRIAASAKRPVVIADTQDNPGGGGHGDTTGLLAELVAQRAQGAVLGLINDAESAAACHVAGTDSRLFLRLGGKSDGEPLEVSAHVIKLTDGRFTLTGPMGKGNPADLGPTALVEVAPGIRVIVVSRKIQAHDQALFHHVGVDPKSCAILALKSSVHFRADFEPIAEIVIVAAAPGPVVADSATLDFRHVRASVRKRPMSNR